MMNVWYLLAIHIIWNLSMSNSINFSSEWEEQEINPNQGKIMKNLRFVLSPFHLLFISLPYSHGLSSLTSTMETQTFLGLTFA